MDFFKMNKHLEIDGFLRPSCDFKFNFALLHSVSPQQP